MLKTFHLHLPKILLNGMGHKEVLGSIYFWICTGVRCQIVVFVFLRSCRHKLGTGYSFREAHIYNQLISPITLRVPLALNSFGRKAQPAPIRVRVAYRGRCGWVRELRTAIHSSQSDPLRGQCVPNLSGYRAAGEELQVIHKLSDASGLFDLPLFAISSKIRHFLESVTRPVESQCRTFGLPHVDSHLNKRWYSYYTRAPS